MATNKVTGGERIRAFIARAKAAHSVDGLEIGFFKDARYPSVRTGKNGGSKQSPQHVTNVAAYNEFGTEPKDEKQPGIPERPFFRQSLADMDRTLLPVLKSSVDSETLAIDRTAAERLGQAAQARIQKQIVELKTPENKPSTVERKGSSNPLIDTSFLKGSVTYKVIG